MLSKVEQAAGTARREPLALPFQPDWTDRLIGGINRLPIPAWLFYPILCGLLFLLINGGDWLQGLAPVGAFSAPYGFLALYPIYPLAAISYLDRTAGKAFDFFRPALGLADADAARLRYELTILPARESKIAAVIGLATFVAVFAYPGTPARPIGGALSYWTCLAIAAAGFVMTAEMLYHTFRQLRLVSRIHALAHNLDLFHFAPLYSFSALTARTGVVFVLVLAFDLAVNPETLANVPLALLNLVILLLCAACFVLPLQGMHQRIAAEKRRLESEVNQRVEAIVQHLYGKVDGLDLKDADAVNKTISSLVATRELIARIPTWPWRPETFTAFFSALTLPIIVFLIQMFLKTIIGFK